MAFWNLLFFLQNSWSSTGVVWNKSVILYKKYVFVKLLTVPTSLCMWRVRTVLAMASTYIWYIAHWSGVKYATIQSIPCSVAWHLWLLSLVYCVANVAWCECVFVPQLFVWHACLWWLVLSFNNWLWFLVQQRESLQGWLYMRVVCPLSPKSGGLHLVHCLQQMTFDVCDIWCSNRAFLTNIDAHFKYSTCKSPSKVWIGVINCKPKYAILPELCWKHH